MGELEPQAELVTAGVEILGVDQRAQIHLDSRPQVLSVRHAQLTTVVDLGSEGGVSINGQLGCQGEGGGVGTVRPRETHASLQVAAELLVERSDEFGSVIDGGVDLEIGGAITESEVALRQLARGSVKCQLVTAHKAFISENGGAMNGGSSEVDVDVSGEMRLLEGRLDHAGSLATRRRERRLQSQLQTFEKLVFYGNLRIQNVVCGPSLRQRGAQILESVFAFQAASDFASFQVGGAGSGESHARCSCRLYFALDSSIVVALVDQIFGGLSEVAV